MLPSDHAPNFSGERKTVHNSGEFQFIVSVYSKLEMDVEGCKIDNLSYIWHKTGALSCLILAEDLSFMSFYVQMIREVTYFYILVVSHQSIRPARFPSPFKVELEPSKESLEAIVNSVKGSLLLFAKALSNSDDRSNSEGSKSMEDEEVQLVRKEKNPAVPPVLPIEFQEPLVSNDLLAKSFSSHTRKLDEYDPSLDIPIALRKGTRSCTKHPICNYVSYDNLSPQFRAFTASLDSTIIPKNIYTALECPEWKNVVMEEMKALEKNRTWEICALPKGHKTIGCKWVFSLKYKAYGTLDRHKARLVANGFTQTYGIDYSETFSPVAVNKDWPLYQLDVKNAFLNGDLMEEVHMSHPPGFEDQFGYNQGHSDHALFTKASKTGKIAILIVYVDDSVLTRDDQTEISQLKQRMGDEFEMKDLGNLKYFLGMEVARSKEGISVSQRKYTLDLLTETGMLGCRPADTPIEFNCKLGNSDDQVPVDKEQYQHLIGKLIYLSHTRPDIYFVVSVVNQFKQAPYEKHMEAINRIQRYLKNTPGNLVTWRSKKKNVVARSIAETEYSAMSLEYVRKFGSRKSCQIFFRNVRHH
ncbi:Cysteine-rich RLK (receptor-like protein kinase) 8 [Cucumis melo var. makuwa]|uniref:Cysteine-rich RLK (Receptor-like protein kinase) 8 n=1 Tax=Cucumis melo var. makuwa TaxID=1194695 RepID=A0A5A7SQA9_CUCMM|nr:Cysteine-rich RLK (receptor-like protein kinase) 8 [Cucumis melo var. makuwa]